MKAMLRAVKLQLSYLNTTAYQAAGAKFIHIPLECDRFEFGSDDYLTCYIQHFSSTVYHPVGTCKMRPDNDSTAVVDSRLRIRCIKNLRQIDASM